MEVGATWVMAAVDSVRDAVVVGLAAAAAVEEEAVLATAEIFLLQAATGWEVAVVAWAVVLHAVVATGWEVGVVARAAEMRPTEAWGLVEVGVVLAVGAKLVVGAVQTNRAVALKAKSARGSQPSTLSAYGWRRC